MTRLKALLLSVPCLLLPACGHEDERINGVVLPDVEFSRFLLSVQHTHLHLIPGNRWVYEAVTAAGTERTSVEVLTEERAFPEVDATTVESSVTLGDELVRVSTEWFAQDNTADVWQFGKDTCRYEGGECASKEGSWVWDGGDARPGIILPGNPEVGGEPYYQVYEKGEIEDVGEVVGVGEAVTVPEGSFTDCVKIRQTSKLDSTVELLKYYCPIVGVALIEDGDVRVELMSFDGV